MLKQLQIFCHDMAQPGMSLNFWQDSTLQLLEEGEV